jgi:hypothetical protein
MEFKTRDKGLTAYLLLCEGIEYLGQESDGRLLFFKFTPSELAEKRKIEYETSNQFLVQPFQYFEKLRLVTRMVGEWREKTFVKPTNGGFYK